MNIHKLQIEGFKSIGKIELIEPNSFSVFVGPNGAGKSNIFEALEFFELCDIMNLEEVVKLFGNINEISRLGISEDKTVRFNFDFNLGKLMPNLEIHINTEKNKLPLNSSSFSHWLGYYFSYNKKTFSEDMTWFLTDKDYLQLSNFSRLLIREPDSKVKRRNQDDSRLTSDASNLEKVLKRILKDEKDRDEIEDILQLLIPGFERLEIRTEELSGSDHLLIYESALKKPINKRLISDGTYNILALIAAIYQSEEPQFLCIEEPENGLNPKVVKQLVGLFRDKCKEKGHYIWLNTHSQTLVAELTTDEIILVDKVNGNTETTQIKGMDLHGMRMDEALLTNTLGGGIPW